MQLGMMQQQFTDMNRELREAQQTALESDPDETKKNVSEAQ